MENFKFFQHKTCEYFPCHKLSINEFNCLFCYCPLYCLGDECGGDFIYLPNGKKSCEKCILPHTVSGYEFIQDHISDIINITRKK